MAELEKYFKTIVTNRPKKQVDKEATHSSLLRRLLKIKIFKWFGFWVKLLSIINNIWYSSRLKF